MFAELLDGHAVADVSRDRRPVAVEIILQLVTGHQLRRLRPPELVTQLVDRHVRDTTHELLELVLL
jgi:hypothetical protein